MFAVASSGTSLSITTTSPLTSATQSTSYNFTMAATGGTPPYTWSLTSQTGSNSWSVSTGGVVSGTPGTIETDSLVIKVTDSVLATSSGTFSLTVNSPAGADVFSIYVNHSGPSVNGQGVGWANDFSFGSNGPVNGSFTSNPFPGHTFSLEVPAGFAYQPAANFVAGFPSGSDSNVGPEGYNLGSFAAGTPTAQDGPFTDITYALWTATPTHTFLETWNTLGFFSAGFADVANASGLTINDITLVPGVSSLVGSAWQTIKIPLPFLGQLGVLATYKTAIKDNNSGQYQLDNIGFVQGSYSWIFNGGLPNGYSNNQTFNATALVAGQNYVIKTVGTTSFTAIGAASNTVGLQFFATGAGTGTGTVTGNFWNFDAAAPISGWSDASVNASTNYTLNPVTIAALGTQGRNFSANGAKTPGYGVQFNGTISGTVLTASSVQGQFAVNQLLLANGISGFPFISSFGTGTGGAGTYNLSFAPGNIGTAATMVTISSTTCAQVTNSATNGMWKVTQSSFSLSGFTRFTFAVLPTNGTHSWTVQFYNTSGVATGTAVTIASGSLTFTPNDNSTGGWTPYVIPLSSFGTLPSNIGGVSIQDTSGVASNVWDLSAIAFMS